MTPKMHSSHSPPPERGKWPLGLRLVLLEKGVSALGLVALAGFTAFLLVQGIDQPIPFLVKGELHEDPNDRIALWLLAHSPTLGHRDLATLEVVWWAWALLLTVEATGLALRKPWAEWLVLAETAAFIPWEVMGLARHLSAFNATVLALNVAILAYLTWRLVHRSILR